MLISYLLGRIKSEKEREDLAAVLAFVLAAVLAFGLVFGLVFGLAAALAFGLVFGLAAALVTGVLAPLWLFIPIILLLTELLFYFDRKKLGRNQGKMWFTLERKAEAFFESLLIVINIMNLVRIIPSIDWKTWIPIIMQYLGWFGVVMLVGAAIYGWIWMNSQRYRKSKNRNARFSKDGKYKRMQCTSCATFVFVP